MRLKQVLAALLLSLELSSCAGLGGPGRTIQLGMSPAEVQAAWGRPDHKSRSVSTWGVTEVWRYGEYRQWALPLHHLTFQDGQLVDVTKH